MTITRLLPADRTSRTRLQNNQRILSELKAKAERYGFLSTLEMKRRTNAEFVISYYNKTGKVA